MKKWLWTFGLGTMFANKYIIVNTDKGDGREILFQIYGKDNLSASYLLDFEPYKEEELREKYCYKKIAVWGIKDNEIYVMFGYNEKVINQLEINSGELTDEFKHKVWDKMIGGI